jgi:MFS family permease
VLIDRAGASTAVAAGEAFAAVGFLLAVATSSPAVLFAGMACIGAGYGVVSPGTSAMANLEIPDSRRGLAMGMRVMGQTTGGAVGGLALPLLAGPLGWRATAVLPVSVCVAVSLAARRDGRRANGEQRGAAPGPVTPIGGSLRQLLWLYGCLMSGLQIALFAYLPVYLVDEKGLSVTAASVGYSLAFALGSVGRVGWGHVSDRVGSRMAPLAVVAVCSGAAFILLPTVPGPAIWPVLALAGLGTASWNGVYQAALVESAGAGRIGRELSRASLFLFIGAIAGPLLLGALVASVGWQAAWLLAAAGTSALGAALWAFGAAGARRVEATA